MSGVWGSYLQLVLKRELMFELSHMNSHNTKPVQISLDEKLVSQYLRFVLPVLSLQLICHIHQGGGASFRHPGHEKVWL